MSPRPALEGLRVLELATFLAGPFTGTILAEFGAEVIKVELPGSGDPTRRYGGASGSGDSFVWMSEGRNKKSITLDLRRPEGAQIARELAAQCDIVVENFQPGTLEGWGLGWDTLSAAKPDLVMVRISGYGQTGPYRDRPGFGRVGNAFGGLSFLAGMPDGPPVTPGSATIADYLSGLFGANGALTALRARDRDGIGQFVDLGIYEPIFRILDELAPQYAANGFVRQRVGPRSVNSCPHSHYPTKDGRWVGIACTSDKIFARLAALMGEPSLADAGAWGTYAARRADIDEVDARVAGWTGERTRDEVLSACEAAQVPCGPIYGIDEIFGDPHYEERENILTVTDPRAGPLSVPNVVPKLSETPGGVVWLGPALGAHNDEIYKGLLKLSDDALAELTNKGVV